MIDIEELKSRGILSGSAMIDAFEKSFKGISYSDYHSASDFMGHSWSLLPKDNRNISGNIFEALFAYMLLCEGILPIYLQAKIAFIPNVNFDLVIYSKQFGPISLSLKTSLRERYKQADLEGMALKNVHRKAKSYLFTFDEKEAERVNRKILQGDVLGIDEVCVVTTHRLNEIIMSLKTLDIFSPDKIDVISSNKIII